VVAVASVATRAREQIAGWLVASLVVLLVGVLLRLAVRPLDVPAASAALLAALLWIGVWLTAVLVSTPRSAFVVGLVAMLALDIAALPPRALVDFDRREALYRTDQTLTLPVPPGSTQLVVLVEPVFDGAQPRFALAGWSCPWLRGRQYVALPLRPGTTSVGLRLTGAPDREGEYLIVYTPVADQPRGEIVRCS
jgi:hypothetical protein